MSVTVGIIGCGGIAGNHLAALKANSADIAAFADINRKAAERFAEDVEGAQVFDDYKTMIDSGAVGAVVICTPPIYHAEAAVYALGKGVHVLCEKPMAHSVQSGKSMVRAAQASSAVLQVAFRHRFVPGIAKIKELVDEGKLGELVLFYNIFCGPAFAMKDKWFSKKEIAGGGCLLDTSSHSVDIFRFLCGEATRHRAFAHTHMDGINVEDAGVLIVEAENGCVGSIQSSWVASAGFALVKVIGQKGTAYHEYYSGKTMFRAVDDDAWTEIPVETTGGFEEQVASFLGAIEGKNEVAVSGADGLSALEVILS